MCWNSDVSLNTFIFSITVLLFVYYNNNYTKYKIKDFSSFWVYLLFASFISMQLLEFFLWKNLNNNKLNTIFTYFAIILILLQPFCSIMMIKDSILKQNMLFYYFILICILLCFYLIVKIKIKTSIADNGHLNWDWLPRFDKHFIFCIIWSFWFFFLFYPLFLTNKKLFLIFGFTLILSMYTFLKHNTYQSMWCWISNFIMLMYLINILVILPYNEKGTLC